MTHAEITTKSIIIFDENGTGSGSIEWPWTDDQIAALDAHGCDYAIVDRAPAHTYARDADGEPVTRTQVSGLSSSRSRILADGVDEAIIGGLPDPCVLLINGEAFDVAGGILALQLTDPGSYVLTLTGVHFSDVLVVEAVDLDAVKETKRAEINAARAAAMLTASTSFGVFDSDAEAKSNINGTVTGIMAVGEENHPDIQFRMADNTAMTFTPAQFVQASLEVSSYLASVYARSWALKAHVDSLTDLAALDAVTWETDIG